MYAEKMLYEEFILPFHSSGGITQLELSRIRQCSDMLKAHPKRNITIIAPRRSQWGQFVMNTLLHFDVSSEQIHIRHSGMQQQHIRLVIDSY